MKIHNHLDTVIIFIFKISGALLLFLFNYFVARAFDKEHAGVIFLSVTLVLILSMIARNGADIRIIKNIALIKKSNKNIIKYVKCEHIRALIFSLIITGFILITPAELISSLFNSHRVHHAITIMAASIVFINTYTILSHAMRAVDRIKIGVFILAILPNCLLVLIIASSAWVKSEIDNLAFAYLASGMIAALFSTIVWLGYSRNQRYDYEEQCVDYREYKNNRFFNINMMQLVFTWGGVVMLGILSEMGEVSRYSIAHRIAMFITFVQVVINLLIGPKISTLFANGDKEAMVRLVRGYTKFSMLCGLAILIAISTTGNKVVLLFGEEYADALSILIVLSIGQLVNVATGPVSLLLMMTGRDKFVQNNMIINASLSILLGIVLIPGFGALGAAIATALPVALQNTVAALYVRYYIGYRVFF